MAEVTKNSQIGAPILALDLGEKRVGVAVSDALAISIKPLAAIERTNWKQLLRAVQEFVHSFDAQTVVIGLPLSLNGSEREAAQGARHAAEKFARSLSVPVYLQDERLTSIEARENLKVDGVADEQVDSRIDSESAVIILRDFLEEGQDRIRVEATSQDNSPSIKP